MPWVEGVEPDDVEASRRQPAAITDQGLVEILVMTVGDEDIVQTTVWLVHPIFGTVEEREGEEGVNKR